ncbi:unnamed protein product, partial [Phaeothamnion confervicola]
VFCRDESRAERWHTEEKYSGRDGNENFPGFGGRPPLVLEGADSAYGVFVSDSSNVDWGIQFTATPEYKGAGRSGGGNAGAGTAHWLVMLDRHNAACAAALAASLITAEPWAGAAEDAHVAWLEDSLLAPRELTGGTDGHTAAPSPVAAAGWRAAGAAAAAEGAEETKESCSAMDNAGAPLKVLTGPAAEAAGGCHVGGGGGGRSDSSEVLRLLEEVVEAEVDTATAGTKLCNMMRKAVREDQGTILPINKAVHATCAALLWHTGLSIDAMALATGKVKSPSKALAKVWRGAQKMRQFFVYGDVRDAIEREREAQRQAAMVAGGGGGGGGNGSGGGGGGSADDALPIPILARGPSVYEGAEERVVEEISAAIVARARFLLSLPSNAAGGGNKEAAKRRWGLLAKAGVVQSPPKTEEERSRSRSVSPHRDRWTALVDSATATAQLRAALAWRRRAAEHRTAKEAGVGDRILRFLQSQIDPVELLQLRAHRDRRARLRVQGLRIARRAVEASGSAPAKAWLLASLGGALRATRRPGQPEPRAHYRSCVEGCDPAAHEELCHEFALLLTACLSTLGTCTASAAAGTATPPRTPTARASGRDALAAAALQACALDYDISDHELLEGSGLVAAMEQLLGDGSGSGNASASFGGRGGGGSGDSGGGGGGGGGRLPEARRAAWELFEVLLPRCVGLEGQQLDEVMEEPSALSKQLMELLVRQAERVAEKVSDVARALEASPPTRGRGLVAVAAAEQQAATISAGFAVGAAAGAAAPESVTLLAGTMSMRRDQVGLVAPHQPLGLEHTVSFWLRRSKGPLDDTPVWKRLAQGKLQAGDAVARGPDWRLGEDDGGDGNVGSVIQASARHLAVLWEATGKRTTCRFNADAGDSRLVFDVLPVDPAVGGVLYCKGGKLALTPEERDAPWSLLGLDLLGDATLRFQAVAGAEGENFAVRGRRRLRPERWEHVAVVVAGDRCRIYVDGEEDGDAALPPALLHGGAAVAGGPKRLTIESPHPYPDSFLRFWDVEVEGAEAYEVKFDPKTASEAGYDYLVFLRNRYSPDDHFGEPRYSGGREGSDSNWPGMQGRSSLVIDAPRFTIKFTSDASSNAWGFKAIITPRLSAEAAAAAADNVAAAAAGPNGNGAAAPLNALPIYLGQAPSYVHARRAAEGHLAGLTIHRAALSPEQIQALAAPPPPPEPIWLDEDAALDVIGLVHRSVRSSASHSASLWTAGAHPLAGPAMVAPLLTMLARGPFRVRVAAARLCCVLLPMASPEVVDVQAEVLGLPAGDGGEIPAAAPDSVEALRKNRFARYLLDTIGRTLSVWTRQEAGRARAADGAAAGVPAASPAAAATSSSEEAFAMAAAYIELLRALGAKDEWSVGVSELLHKAWASVPAVVRRLQAATSAAVVPPAVVAAAAAAGSAAATAAEEELLAWQAYAGLAVLGGLFEGVYAGGVALCQVGSGDASSVERCTVLAQDWPAEHAAAAKMAATALPASATAATVAAVKAAAKSWDGLGAWGDALWVALESDPDTAVVLSRRRLAPALSAPPSPFLAATAGAEAQPLLVAAFEALLTADDADPRPRRLPLVDEADRTEMVETAHPLDSANVYETLKFEGSSEIKITFDPSTRVPASVYVTVFKNENQSGAWGRGEYRGGDDARWPGVNGEPPLLVPADSCVVHIHTEGGNGDEWGVRLMATAHCVRRTAPPDVVPSLALAALASLRAHGMRALQALVRAWPPFVGAALPLLRPLAAAACAKRESGSGGGATVQRAQRELVFETEHPYPNSADIREVFEIPGAKMLLISFDAQSKTEANCDYMTFYLDEVGGERVGEEKYTGGRDGGISNWPGTGGRPPLEVPGGRVAFRFSSDGSVNDWGVKMTATPVFPDTGFGGLSEPTLAAKVHHLSCLLRDTPRAQPQAEGLERFPLAPAEPQGGAAAAAAVAAAAGSPAFVAAAAKIAELEQLAAVAKGERPAERPDRLVLHPCIPKGLRLRRTPQDEAEEVGRLMPNEGALLVSEKGDWAELLLDKAVGEAKAASEAASAALAAAAVGGSVAAAHTPPPPPPATVWAQRRQDDNLFLVLEEAADFYLSFLEGPDPDAVDLEAEAVDGAGATGGGGGAMAQPELPPAYAVANPAGSGQGGAGGVGDAFDLTSAGAVVGDVGRLWTAATECARVMTAKAAQGAVAAMLSSWPEGSDAAALFSGSVGDSETLLRLLSDRGGGGGTGDIGGGGSEQAALDAIRRKLLDCVRAGGPAATALVPALTDHGLAQMRLMVRYRSGMPPVRGVIMNIETEHPHPGAREQTWRARLDGARRIVMWCDDERCDSMVESKMTVYRDDSKEAVWGLPAYRGRNWPGVGATPRVSVGSDHATVVFKCEAENGDRRWGFKMSVFFVMDEPAAEQRAALRELRRAAGPAQVSLACYVMELLCREPHPAVRAALYGPAMLAALREYLQTAPPPEQLWATRLLTSMLQEMRPTAAAAAVTGAMAAAAGDAPEMIAATAALRRIAVALAQLTAYYAKTEEGRGTAPRSPLLQALV